MRDHEEFFRKITSSPDALEAKASELSIGVIGQILEGIAHKKLDVALMDPLLRGITPTQFRGILQESGKLPHSLIEAAGHARLNQHLFDLAVWLQKEAQSEDERLCELQREIQAGIPNLTAVTEALNHRAQHIATLVALGDKALLLAWNTNTAELIERLSFVKEHFLTLLESDNPRHVTLPVLRRLLPH
jgi:hypothetical protein